MLKQFSIFLPTVILLFSCNENANPSFNENGKYSSHLDVIISENKFGRIKDIPVPFGFTFLKNSESSFGAWLQNVSLKTDRLFTCLMVLKRKTNLPSLQYWM